MCKDSIGFIAQLQFQKSKKMKLLSNTAHHQIDSNVIAPYALHTKCYTPITNTGSVTNKKI